MRSHCQLPARKAAVTVNTRSLLGSSRSAVRRGDKTPAIAPLCGHSFAAVPVHTRVDLPRIEEGDLPLKVTAPPVGPGRKPSTPAATECVKPYSMVAVTSGEFLDGLTMDDYYPGLRAKGYFSNPSTAGPWDTGSRCGVNVQLVGDMNLLCRDELFQFTQTVHHDKSIINGSPDADHGTTHDDIADSGGDFTKPPRRQARTAARRRRQPATCLDGRSSQPALLERAQCRVGSHLRHRAGRPQGQGGNHLAGVHGRQRRQGGQEHGQLTRPPSQWAMCSAVPRPRGAGRSINGGLPAT
jgi:hypothetical protein